MVHYTPRASEVMNASQRAGKPDAALPASSVPLSLFMCPVLSVSCVKPYETSVCGRTTQHLYRNMLSKVQISHGNYCLSVSVHLPLSLSLSLSFCPTRDNDKGGTDPMDALRLSVKTRRGLVY